MILLTAFILGLIAGIILTLLLSRLSAFWQRASRARFDRVRVAVGDGKVKNIIVRRS